MYDSRTPGMKLNTSIVEIELKNSTGVSALIGSWNGQGADPLDGIMDELSIFNKTLTEEEIQELMNETCKRFSASRKYRRIYCKDFMGAKNWNIDKCINKLEIYKRVNWRVNVS